MKKLLKAAVAAALMVSFIPGKTIHADSNLPGTIKDQFQVSPGVIYDKTSFLSAGADQTINILDINLADPFTKVEVGIPNPIDKSMSTTGSANLPRTDGNRVVGAINGSFYHTSNHLPTSLIVKDNALIYEGEISQDDINYINEPIAFGVTADGKSEIDNFNMIKRVQFENQNFPFSSVNRQRDNNELIVYTSSYGNGYTNTNEFGTELVVVTDQPKVNDPLKFGDQLTGKIQQIRSYGDKTNTKIPENGFVLSYKGTLWNERLKGLTTGEQVSISLSIDSKWMNAKYMLASGPMLVKDGNVFLTIDENSSRARERTARTAVAIDKTKNRVFLVTVDGSRSDSKVGMTLKEFAEYLVKLGVDRALNLDGGGSTTMAARLQGQNQVSLMNTPMDGVQRGIATTLHAVSTAPIGQPTQLKVTRKQQGKLLVGSTLDISLDYVLDQYFNSLPMNASDVKVSIPSGIAKVTGMKITGTTKGDGKIIIQYGNATQEVSLSVVDKINQFQLNKNNSVMSLGQTQRFSTAALDESSQPIIFNPSLVEWSVTGDIGSISKDGTFTATKKGTGIVTAKYGQNTVSTTIKVTDEPIVMDEFEDNTMWTASTSRADALVQAVQNPEPVKNGMSSLKLTYDFSIANGQGTAAAYVNPKNKINMDGLPVKLGLWVFGDGQNHWLRGKILDNAGKSYTINFTEEGKLNWTGWRYVEAELPTNAVAPLSLQQIYLAEATASRQGKGIIYLDKLQAIYMPSYEEPMFNDVKEDFWAKKEIEYLSASDIINGYPNGNFQPEKKLTRAHAAVLLARALKLDTTNVKDISYNDVPKSHPYYAQISAVVNSGIMNGKGNGVFDPEGNLTRAQMAAILSNAYKLTGVYQKGFNDVPSSFWASKQIQALAANEVTTGYPDGSFKPGATVTRVQYSAFLYRILIKNL